MKDLEISINFYESKIPLDILEKIQREINVLEIPKQEKQTKYVSMLVEGYRAYLRDLEEYVQKK